MTGRGRGRPRQTHCYMNHLRTPENLTKSGGCRDCNKVNARLRRRKSGEKNARRDEKNQKRGKRS